MHIRKLVLMAGLVVAVALPLLATSIYAATNVTTYTVNSTADKPDANIYDNVCQTSSATPECTLRAAVMQANQHAGTETININQGTYNLTGSPDGDNPNAATGDLDITADVTIQGAGRGLTYIDGQGKDRIFDLQSGTNVSLSSMTVRNGYLSSGVGSAIRALGNKVTLYYLIVEKNNGSTPIWNQIGEMDLSRTIVRNNILGIGGGAGGIFSEGVLLIDESLINNNHGFQGGGIAAFNTTFIVNTTISDNIADYRGGGITFGNADIPVALDLSNVTITGNHANPANGQGKHFDSGGAGGIDKWNSDDTALVRNSIIAGNVDEYFPNADYAGQGNDCVGDFTTKLYNLIGDGWNCGGFVDGSSGDQVGTSDAKLDPKLGPLANNGGYTYTHALLSGSPAIDKGNVVKCTDHYGNTLTTDQRGFNRPIDGDNAGGSRCDIGAFEYGSTTYPTPTPNPCNSKPAAPTLNTPGNGTKVKQTHVALDWDGVSCGLQYKVMVRQNSKTGPKMDKKTLQTTEYITKELPKSHTYFWSIKACNANGCTISAWQSFKVK